MNVLNILFIVTELKSANGICTKAVMNEYVKKGHNVYCITNRENDFQKEFTKEGVKYFTVRPRFIYKFYSFVDRVKAVRLKKLLSLVCAVLNKLKLFLSVPIWPLISYSYTLRIYKKAVKICKEKNIEYIIPIYTQIDTLIAANKIKEKTPKMKYVPYFLDSLSGGYGPKCFSKEWTIKRGLKWEEKLLNNADLIIAMESSREHHEKYSIGRSYYSKIKFLDLPLLTEQKTTCPDSNFLDKDKINLLYIGTIPAHIRNPKYFLGVFNHIKSDNIILNIVGSNTCPELIADAIKKDCRIRMYPFVNHNEAVSLINQADILVNFGNNNPSMTPSKIFEYMSAGKPIVSTAPITDEPSIKYLKKYDLAFIVDEGEKDIEKTAIELEKFITKNCGKKVDFTHLEKEFYKNTPMAFYDCILNNSNRSQRILLLNSCNFGSTGNIMLQIAETAKNQGHMVITACPDCRDNRKKQVKNQILICNRISRNIHLKLAFFTGLNGFFSYFSTLNFLKKVKKYKPDLVHIHNLHNCYINLKMLFKFIKKHDIKTVWTLHDCWSFTGHCPYFDMIGCDKWKTGCYKCPQYRDYPQSFFDNSKYMYRLKKKWFTEIENLTIVTPSQWLGDLVKQSFLKDYPVKVIHNGIDLSVFKPTNSGFRKKYDCENKYILLGVAFDWGKRKGLDVFIELYKRLDEKYQIVLVGTNDNIDKQLPNNIISIHRTQNQTELAEIYTAADLFVNPTREEALGLVNIEALACGTPVVTFNSGGSPECVDETCGCVVQKNDIDALYDEIIRICEQNPYSREACQQRAKSFNKTEKFEEYIKLYKESNGE